MSLKSNYANKTILVMPEVPKYPDAAAMSFRGFS